MPKTSPTSAQKEIGTQITDQSALFARPDDDLRVNMLVAVGDRVAQGAPVLRSRRYPELIMVSPVAGEVAAIDLGPGKRLSHVLFFRDADGDRHRHDTSGARGGDNPEAVRAALLSAGMWSLFRSRPFGRVPLPQERPAAIFVMALDTRPDAPPPLLALGGQLDALAPGLRALTSLTDGLVYICHDGIDGIETVDDRVKSIRVDPVHPRGLAGLQILDRFPASTGATVWDIHAEDVAGIGSYIETGLVPETRLVSVSGSALRESRMVRCQPGADLRALSFDIVKPGPHRLLSGSALDGVEGRWLGPWRRQVAVIAGTGPDRGAHWFSAALRRSSRPLPIIPSVALDHAFGGILPAALMVRALAANDAETATRLGALSLLEEDVALADYLTAAAPPLTGMLRAMLNRIATEEVA